jgi:hypothetical protein
MRRLPSVNRLVDELEQLVKTAEAEQNNATAVPPKYSAPIAAELQKVAEACRSTATNVTVNEVTAFARALMGGSR